MVQFGNDWDQVLAGEFDKPYYQQLRSFLKEEYLRATIYPPMHDIFNAFKYTSFQDTKVVILGQDPYHNPHQAHGLAFSVLEGNPLPPSLKNIFDEISQELGIQMGNCGNLTKWAQQGVLLLNAVLTVRYPIANSHKGMGWEILTDEVIKHLNERDKPIIFLLWGNDAGKKAALITNPHHMILKSSHPSPLSAYQSFFGCGHFKKTNEQLRLWHQTEIDWSL